MKKIFFVFMLIGAVVLAQTEQKSIELPDFVITGKQSIEIPTAQKRKPELISTISEDFILPQYSPYELPLLISSQPVSVKPSIVASEYFDGSVKIGVGSYTYPEGSFHFSKSLGNYIFSADAWGKNIKEYVPFSGYNTSGVALGNNLFISTNSDFLPGTQIKLNGQYYREAYKFYASSVPNYERKLQNGFGVLSIMNNYNRWVDFGFDFGLNTLSFDESGLDEKIINGSALFNFKTNGFVIGGRGNYDRQVLKNNLSGIGDYDFYSVEGFIKSNITNNMILKGGLFYAGNNSTNFISPFASMQYKIADGLTFSAEYNPRVENITYRGMLNKNMYAMPLFTDNVFKKVKADLNAGIKYEHYKFFSITLSGGYSKIDNYFYFTDSFRKGMYDIFTADNVGNFSTKLDLLFHPAEFGYFFGNVKYNSVKNDNDKYIPYEPILSSEMIYGYDFHFGFGFKVKFVYAKEIYTDLTNTTMLDDYHNLSLGISYKIWESLSIKADFQNILNKTNFVLRGYEEKPFDIIIGAEYRW